MNDFVDLKIVRSYEEAAWKQATHHLFIAQAITKIEPNSSFHSGGDIGPCSVWHAYDAMVDEISENYLTAAIRFSSIFTALECVAKARSAAAVAPARDAKQNAAGARKLAEGRSFSQLGEDLDARFSMTTCMRQALDAAKAACDIIGDLNRDLDEISRHKDGRPCSKDTFGYCLKLVKKFRNNFAHGHEKIVMPDNQDIHSGKIDNVTVALIDRHQVMSRMALMLMQLCLIADSRCEVELKVGQYEDQHEEWEDFYIPASEALEKIHFDSYGTHRTMMSYQGPFIEVAPKNL